MTAPTVTLRRVVHHALHPLLLAAVAALVMFNDNLEVLLLLAFLWTQIALRICERLVPAHADWQQPRLEVITILWWTVLILVLTGIVNAVYAGAFGPGLQAFGASIGVQHWPTRWPLLLQVLLLFFCSEFIYYWIHRAIHRFTWLWRSSGHGFHHAFHNLHAINALTSHPMELLFLALPALLLGQLFGADSHVVLGATAFIVVNASIAHANLDLSQSGVGWLFTTSNHHQVHHSPVLEQSNSNFSCNAIIWDRLFGTCRQTSVDATGIGPRPLTFWNKLLLPFREPDDTTASPAHLMDSAGRQRTH